MATHALHVLIATQESGLSTIWARHLERAGLQVTVAADAERAIRVLNHDPVTVLIVNLSQDRGEALTIADYAAYRRPGAKVIFVTSDRFFSDGSIFQHVSNAAVLLPSDTSADDLLAVVEHHGGLPSDRPGA